MPSKSSPAFFGLTPATKALLPLPYSRHVRVWNCPVLPVMPWVITFVFLLTRMLIYLSLHTSRRSDGLLSGLGHVVRANDRQPGLGEDFLAQLLVGALHAYDEGDLELDLARCRDDPGGDGVALHDAAEDVDQYRLQARIAQHDLERFSNFFGRRATADVEEVRGRSPIEFDRVHGRHGEPGAVDQAADVAVERDVREIELRRLDFGGIFLVVVAHFDDIGMADRIVVVDCELRVELDHATVAGDDQRIDLGERRIGLVECPIQPLQHLPGLPEARFRNADSARERVRLGVGETLHRVDEDLVNFFGRLRGDFLDVHAALRARHQDYALRSPVDDHPDVELFADVRSLFDQQPPHFLTLRARLVRD